LDALLCHLEVLEPVHGIQERADLVVVRHSDGARRGRGRTLGVVSLLGGGIG
jgi:hypothetical protein